MSAARGAAGFLAGGPGPCFTASALTLGAGSRLTVVGEWPRDPPRVPRGREGRRRPQGSSRPGPWWAPRAGAGLRAGAGSGGGAAGFACGAGPLCSYEQYFGAGTRLTVIGEIWASPPRVPAAAPRSREKARVGQDWGARSAVGPRGQPCEGAGTGSSPAGHEGGGPGGCGALFLLLRYLGAGGVGRESIDEDAEPLDWGTGLRRENRGCGEDGGRVAAIESGDRARGAGKSQGQAWDWRAPSRAGSWGR